MKHFLPFLATLVMAAEPQDTLDRLLLANRLRADLAREQAALQTDLLRLDALRSATEAATAQTRAETEAAEHRAAALAQHQAPVEDLDVALTQAADRLDATLTPVIARLPPGTVPPAAPAGAAPVARLDAAVLRLDAAERAATTVAVSVVTGRLPNGTAQAVKLLRLGGSAPWWIGLDGRTAGHATQAEDGTLHLHPASGQVVAIAAAVAQAEGREAPTVVLLSREVRP